MLKYAKVINEETNVCIIGEGYKSDYYTQNGMTLQDVECSDVDGLWYLVGYAPMKTDEQKAQEEAERIAMLNLTAADVERGIYKAIGKDFDDIVEMVTALQPVGIDIKALKIELKANNFYRGNPYVSAVGDLLGFTKEQLDKFFETNDYKYLTNVKFVVIPTPENSTVIINGVEGNELVLPYGNNIDYVVSAEGYVEVVGQQLKVTEDTEVTVVLEPDVLADVTVGSDEEVETPPVGAEDTDTAQ